MKKRRKCENLFKLYVLLNPYKSYYMHLKKGLPERIKNGEIEWIYSYGDWLIRDGKSSVLAKVRELVKSKECDNPYINHLKLYRECLRLKKKYWWKISR